MDIVKIYNEDGDFVEKVFSDSLEADSLEDLLDWLDIRYERFHNEEKWY